MRKPIELQAKANSPGSDDELMAALLEVANEHGREVVLYGLRGESYRSEPALKARLRELLEQAIEDRGDVLLDLLPAPLGKGKTDIAGAVMKNVVPKLHLDLLGPRGLYLRLANYYPDLETAMNYAVLLLLDLGREYGSTLSRCRLSSCSDFYFAKKNPKGGPANRQYCCPEHRTIASDKKQNRTRKHK